MKITTLVLVAILLAGCSAAEVAQRQMADDPTIASKPIAYRQGFDEGCQSGVYESRLIFTRASERFIRDDARMKTDADYAMGWNDGARRCKVN